MSAPVLYNYVISQLSKSAGWKTENFAPEKKTANVLVIDGLSLVSVLYPPSLDWVLPSWKELHNRVKMFVHRLTERGFNLVVFFSVQREDETIDERKPTLLERYHWLTKVMRDIQSAQALPEDNFYFTPVRTITSAVCRAFQSCPLVNVIVTPLETVKAITTYCNMHKATIHAVVGTDLSEALIYPTPALISLHPAVFDWQSLWSGRQVSVFRVKRFHVYQSLVPAACLPVFASLVGNPIFSRDNLKGFYKSSLPHDVFDAAKGFIQECIKNITGRATPDEFAKRLYAKLELPSLDYEQFLRLFRRSCNAYALPPGESPVPIIPETDVDTIYQQSFYFFEPLMEATNMPSVLLLRPIRMRSLHLKFGAMTFAEVYVNPQGTIATDYLTVPLAETTTDQASKMPILQRWQFFETLSGVDLTPVMKFDAKMQLQSPEEAWFYLTVMTMARLEGREVFRRKQELKRLLAQFVSLPEIHTLTDLPEGTVSLESVTLAHLFHNTIVHLSRLNKSCGSPFPTYTEWQLFDGSVYALADSVLFSHPAFKKHEQRYTHILHTIESNLPSNALIDEPAVTALQPLFRLGRGSQQQQRQQSFRGGGGHQGQQQGYQGGQGGGNNSQKPGPSLTHLPTWFHRQGRGQGRWGQGAQQGVQGGLQPQGGAGGAPQQGGGGVTQLIAAAAAAANIPMHTVIVPNQGGGSAPQLSAAPGAGGNTVMHIGNSNANNAGMVNAAPGQVANTLLSLLSNPQQRSSETESSTGAMQKLLSGMLEGMKQQHGSSEPSGQGAGAGGDSRRSRRQKPRQGGDQQTGQNQNQNQNQKGGQQEKQQSEKQQGQQKPPQKQGKQQQQQQGKQGNNQQNQQGGQNQQVQQQKQKQQKNNNNNQQQKEQNQNQQQNQQQKEQKQKNKQQKQEQQAQQKDQKDQKEKETQKEKDAQAGDSEDKGRARKPKPKWVRKEAGSLENTSASEGGSSPSAQEAATAQPAAAAAASDAVQN